MASWAARYEAGQHRAVWEEMRAAGPDALAPARRADAEEVARLTMARVAGNVAVLSVRLTLLGYRFGQRYSRNRRRRTIVDLGLRKSMESAGRDVSWVDEGDVEETVMGWPGPRGDVVERLAGAEAILGAELPLALRALVVAVDTVDLAGSFLSWEPSAFDFDDDLDWPPAGRLTDPFNLLGIDVVAEHLHPDTGELDPTHLDDDGRFALPIANDAELSANRVGGVKTVLLPDPDPVAVIDPVIHGVTGRPGIRLVDYLRCTFEWAGFPGFELEPGPYPPELAQLRRGLSPL